MDNVVTQLLVLRGDGRVEEQAGGFSDWEARGGRLLSLGQPDPVTDTPSAPQCSDQADTGARTPASKSTPKKKLSYREQQELDQLPGAIEAIETRKAEVEGLSADPDFYQRPQDEVQALLAELAELGTRLDECLERWTELEERA